LILGSVFVLQYLTGREPHVLGRPIRRPATLLGWGLLVALGSAFVPIFLGGAPLESYIWKFEIALIGEVKWVSSTIFDLGVYLVVVAVVLLILLSLGTSSSATAPFEEDYQ
jgi:multisubunit Na+/H+ antiporter MnhB subunit